MFLTIEIRGAAQTVRRRDGEEVSDPVLEFDEGEEMPAPMIVARLDHQRLDKDGYVQQQESVFDREIGPFQDLRVVGSAAGAFTGDSSEQTSDGYRPRERQETPFEGEGELLHLVRESPRRFLRRLRAEAAVRGKVTVRFIEPLEAGRAIADFTVEGNLLVVSARLEVARALGGALGAKSQGVRGLAGFEIELEAKLRGDGDLDDVLGEVRVRGLDLGAKEQRLLSRLARVMRRVVDGGGDSEARRHRVTRILHTWLREHPIWAVALLERLFCDLEHLPLNPSVRQQRADRGGPTLDDILSGNREPGTDELRLDAPPPPGLEWIDDHHMRVVTGNPKRSAFADRELARLACVLPVLLESLQ